MNDAQLIRDYQKGDENALATLLNKYQNQLYTFIFYKVGDEELANDFFQDTFIKIVTTLKGGSYNEEGKFYPWAKRIAQNLIIDFYRGKTKNVHISESSFSEEDGYSIFDFIPESSANVEELLIDLQIKNKLHQLLDYLPENQREVIEMRFFKDMSFKEIAEETRSSINTTLGRARYALINLRKLIEEYNIILTTK